MTLHPAHALAILATAAKPASPEDHRVRLAAISTLASAISAASLSNPIVAEIYDAAAEQLGLLTAADESAARLETALAKAVQ